MYANRPSSTSSTAQITPIIQSGLLDAGIMGKFDRSAQRTLRLGSVRYGARAVT